MNIDLNLDCAREALLLPCLIAEDFSPSALASRPVIWKSINHHLKLQMVNGLERHPHRCEVLNPFLSQYRRIGRYFEAVIKAGLEVLTPEWTVYSNIQVRNPYKEGELDFVLQGFRATHHLEVAIKFYLYLPSFKPTTSNFVGPGLKDLLSLKLEKVFQEQLLKHVPIALRAPVGAVLHRYFWLSGMIFYPWDVFKNHSFPNFSSLKLNPSHSKGWWMTLQNGRDLKSTGDDQTLYFEVPRPFWVVPPSLSRESFESLGMRLLDLDNLEITEPLFCIRSSASGAIEDRGFLVPNGWPKKAFEFGCLDL